MIGIYKILSPKGRIYIGQSTDIEKRKSRYRSLSCKGQRKLYSSFKKYGWNNHVFEIVEILPEGCEENLIDQRERYHYDFYNNKGFRMLNLSVPGNKGNRSCSEQTKTLISEIKTSKVSQFDKFGKLIKIWNSAKEISNELKLAYTTIIASTNGGCKSAGGYMFRKGEYKTDILPIAPRKKVKIRIKNGKRSYNRPVFQYSLEGNFIKEWFSMKEAAETLNLNHRCISAANRGKLYQTGGFRWSTNKY